jgi:hypothetical protein
LQPFAFGAFCDVFDLGDGRVFKAFRRIRPAVHPAADPDLIPQIAFGAELLAYETLKRHPRIASYAPAFFGAADASSFLQDDVPRYAPGCGLILEKIPGEPRKLFELEAELEREVARVIDEMGEVVFLDDPWDGCCFVPGTRASFTLIDFATPSERFGALDETLIRHGGVVPPEFRHLLGLPPT